jgi:CDP-paratose synthetase
MHPIKRPETKRLFICFEPTTFYNQPVKILLTGATGYLGSHLLKRLWDGSHEVTILKRSHSKTDRIQGLLGRVQSMNADEGSVEEIVARVKPDAIIHCATHYGRKDSGPINTVESNLILPLRLLSAASEQGVKLFVNTDTVLDKRVSNYSLSKRQFTEWLETFSTRITCINVALEHFYGAGDDSSKFVSWIIEQLLANVPEIQLTEGAQQRDFIFIDDVIDAFVTILKAHERTSSGFFRFEVGSGATVTIREFVETVRELSGNRSTLLKFGAIPYRENEVMQSHVDLSLLSQLGWKAKTSLKEGLTQTMRTERGLES